MSALTLLLQSSHGDPMVALGRDGDVLFDSSADPQFDQSRDLRVMLEAGLAAVGAHVSDISKIGCDIGPGGLGVTRTAASFANALSYARDLPLYPIRAFDLLGAEFGRDAPLVILRRAGRPFVHFGLYENGALTLYRHGKEDEVRADISALAPFDMAGNMQAEDLPPSQGNHASAQTMLTLVNAATHQARAYPIVEDLT